MRKRDFAIAILLGFFCLWLSVSVEAKETKSTFDAVLEGRNCKHQKDPQQIVCDYNVGRDLKFTIAGVGEIDAAVTFLKVDWDGDYYATFGIMHGCVIVKPGSKNKISLLDPGSMAFVSPKNGKVYKSWKECMNDPK